MAGLKCPLVAGFQPPGDSGLGPYLLQQSETLAASIWSGVLTTSSQNATLPITNASSFFRVQGQ
jgi:hypothetical protein